MHLRCHRVQVHIWLGFHSIVLPAIQLDSGWSASRRIAQSDKCTNNAAKLKPAPGNWQQARKSGHPLNASLHLQWATLHDTAEWVLWFPVMLKHHLDHIAYKDVEFNSLTSGISASQAATNVDLQRYVFLALLNQWYWISCQDMAWDSPANWGGKDYCHSKICLLLLGMWRYPTLKVCWQPDWIST